MASPSNHGSPLIAGLLFASALPFIYDPLSCFVVIYIHCPTAEPLQVPESFAGLTPTHSFRFFCSSLVAFPNSAVWIRYLSSVCPKHLVFIHITVLIITDYTCFLSVFLASQIPTPGDMSSMSLNHQLLCAAPGTQ